MMVTGADDNLPLEVCGCWLIRDEISHLIKANDDAEFYTWTKVATPGGKVSATDKAKIQEFWTAEWGGQLEGRPVSDVKQITGFG